MSVYQPAEDTFLLEQAMRRYCKGLVLDMGTGSGYLAHAATKTADAVIGVDTNPEAIAHASRNAPDNAWFIESDLFSFLDVEGMRRLPKELRALLNRHEARFDLVIFNAPYLPADEQYPDQALDGGPSGCELLARFIEQLHPYLKATSPGGSALVICSSQTRCSVHAIARKHGLLAQVVARKKVFFEELRCIRLWHDPVTLMRQYATQAGLEDAKVLAKGRRGIVYQGTWKGMHAVAKVPRLDCKDTTGHEAMMLAEVNRLCIGPKLLVYGEGYVIMQLVSGPLFEDWLTTTTEAEKKRLIKRVMEQCLVLDKAGIQKQEMNHPSKHIIIENSRDNCPVPVLVDFERARKVERPANVTQFCQYLLSPALTSHIPQPHRQKVISVAGAYDRERSQEAYVRVCETFGI
ncbi:hypothetical protein COY28_06330 [Candidatus Woesearchaeota archaeon CG_4_10_14_0_2_um_filter_57_5]|nr:MAG: hypothetical protein AUJ68_05205 [Candidatus Woesearchaeota archaeon CG1_02_57_44]PIN68621.1 MAG: hypothetical protein COV94_03910 [Candidatus Woesearchaeota archaeon CG11_big_fil_rev_8_21_14_0_20_57_5]PIZ49426.1 MAG: hypothetical protein COY28_06330 [Candidatus Woesearchaeota archaeon CG_4_10_14_0_2_um_filter_57_5]